MKDKMLIEEVRKRVSLLESKYETMKKDLESARGFLAMLEREAVNTAQSVGDRTHVDIVADIVVDILSHSQETHRSRILETVLERGVHIGNDDNPQRQLAGLSSIMSKDPRIKPTEGKGGYWSLAIPIDHEPSEGKSEADNSSQANRSLVEVRLANEEKDVQLAPARRGLASHPSFRR